MPAGSLLVKREMLGRELLDDYFSLPGLQRLIGEPIENFNAVISSELFGNSIDMCDERYCQQEIKEKIQDVKH